MGIILVLGCGKVANLFTDQTSCLANSAICTCEKWDDVERFGTV